MDRVYITKVLSSDLKSRSTASILYSYIECMNPENLIIDFSGVNFATRSFMDEFYNVFIKELNIRIDNVPSDIEMILDAVERTQNKAKEIPAQDSVKTFASVDEFCSYVSALAF